jgi:hypothetical protein
VSIVVHKDLSPSFGPPRDQGARPTCLAFATSDCHAALLGPWKELSCEWIYNRAQVRAGRSHADGATLPSMLDALRRDGQPVEAGWPYQPTVRDPWEPPAGSPDLFKRDGSRGAADANAVTSILNTDRPVIMLMTLSRSFFRPDPDGVVRPSVGEQPDPAIRHAVIATAHGLVDSRLAVRIRNSWGAGWGLNGSAWLTNEFLAARLFATAELLGAIDVSFD